MTAAVNNILETVDTLAARENPLERFKLLHKVYVQAVQFYEANPRHKFDEISVLFVDGEGEGEHHSRSDAYGYYFTGKVLYMGNVIDLEVQAEIDIEWFGNKYGHEPIDADDYRTYLTHKSFIGHLAYGREVVIPISEKAINHMIADRFECDNVRLHR